MPKEIGWSQEAYLLAQVKALLARVGSMSPVTGGITSLNGLTDATQTFAVGTAGTGLTITSSAGVHTFNIPNASATAKGLLTAVDWSTFSNKLGGTGTVNYISKFTASGTIGNSQIFDNGTNVGIGTASPNRTLDVNGVIRTQSGTIDLGNGTADQIYNLGSNLYLKVNSADRLYIAGATGNVGIGTTSPQAKLHIGPSLNVLPANTSVAITGDTYLRFTGGSDGNSDYGSFIYGTQFSGVRSLQFGTRQGSGDVAVMTIRNTDVGIGTTAPSATLDVRGGNFTANFQANSGFSKILVRDSTAAYQTVLGADAGGGSQYGFVGTESNHPFAIRTNNTERMRITATGNVGIGTTSPGSILHAVSSNNEGFILDGIGAQGTRIEIRTNNTAISYFGDGRNIFGAGYNNSTVLSTGGANFMAFGTNLTERMRITSGGDVGIGTTSPSQKLTVSGNIRAEAAANVNTYVQAIAGTSETTIFNNGAVGGLYQAGSVVPMTFSTNGGERMRITAGGSVLVGTTTDVGVALNVNGNIRVSNTIDSAGDIVLRSLNSNTRVYIGDVNTVNNQMIIGNNGSSAFTFVGNNFGISQTTFGTNATKTLAISTGVAPTTSPVDAIQMYSADVVAGNAAPHFRTENGAVVKVYQETTGVAAATRVGGGGTTVTDTDTFDGYTIAQVVKALRNQGLLA